MSELKHRLIDMLTRFDDDAFIALSNKGLFRRARKDFEQHPGKIVEENDTHITLQVNEQIIKIDAKGPAFASCSCPASGICQHILSASLTLKNIQEDEVTRNEVSEHNFRYEAKLPTESQAEDLHETLLSITRETLIKHAGKPGFRWAWELINNLDLEQDVAITRHNHIVIGFTHPTMTLRYLGGGVDSLICDLQTSQLAKYQVAAVILYKLINGVNLDPLEVTTKPQNSNLDFGIDYAIAESKDSTLISSRNRLLSQVDELLNDCLILGISHLSHNMLDKFSSFAVWAQGVYFYRLSLLLRRIAEHVELQIERSANADGNRIFEDLAFAYGLTSALQSSLKTGVVSSNLQGKSRSQYEEVGSLVLLGLGAQAWRTPSGFLGLTMLFWSPETQQFLACSDARPEAQGGFNPITRYKTSGPWTGLGSPSKVTGMEVRLDNASVNNEGRISASESIISTQIKIENFANQLNPFSSWNAMYLSYSKARQSLLASPRPLDDWICLKPSKCQEAKFDEIRQKLIWNVIDDLNEVFTLEVSFSPYTEHAIKRIEQLSKSTWEEGDLIVVKLISIENRLIGEPLSIVRRHVKHDENAVDALFFDEPKKVTNFAISKLTSFFKSKTNSYRETDSLDSELKHARFENFKKWLLLNVERGLSPDRMPKLMTEYKDIHRELLETGYTALPQWHETLSTPSQLLKARYICMQYERIFSLQKAS
ncbi:hypothetical protein ACFQ1T_02755 [Methylophilus glucosoxydans]|uniref:SWIM-type domain-containing protein n=1 Tax=Methylophilus glucosoxydans TaxID=752553 RepID=A0ABW3GJ92_9PROT